ncbi:MAG: ABC transporter permease [Phycisphaerales bacterium]|nr:ABC transporter permease [Phycisphaerales bacterium]
MRRMSTIAWRELRAFYLAPAGWIVPALFLFGSGLVFMQSVFHAGYPASVRAVIGFNAIFLLLAGPAIVMGSICEERRRGTLALLQSSPCSAWDVIAGKWLGAMGILFVLVLPTLLQVILLEVYGRPDLGEVGSGYLGLILLGGAVLASGILASTLVSSQAVAFLVTCIGWILVSVVLELALPKVLGPTWRGVLVEFDPLQRLSDFTMGLVDSANVAYFVSVTIVMLIGAGAVLRIGRSRAALAIGLCGMFILLIGFNAIALKPTVRWHADATKSRDYSLSPRTMSLLENLDGDWRISIMLAEQQVDPAILRQIDEVLSQFARAAPNVSVQRLDPTNPASVIGWESVLADLRALDPQATAKWKVAVEAGIEAFETLIVFAQQAAGPIRGVPGHGPQAEELDAGAAALAVLAAQGHRIVQEVRKVLTAGDHRPLPDWATARAVLQQGLTQWASELDATSRALQGIDEEMPVAANAAACAAQAASLALAADHLARLEAMPSDDLGQYLMEGESAVVIGPGGARVIPASQLIPSTFSSMDSGRIAFDQRFRGEQLLAAAVQSIADRVAPRVVFVHDGERSVLASGQPNTDVSGVATMLRAGRVEVQQWRPHIDASPPPWDGGPTAWVILPPTRRGGLQMESSEAAMLKVTRELLLDGQGVLLSFFPSTGPKVGQVDPWAKLAAEVGVEVSTGEVLLRAPTIAGRQTPPEAAVELAEFSAPHPVAAALHGQSLLLPMAIPLQTSHDDAIVLGSIEPAADLWVEDDWRALVSSDARLRRHPPQFDNKAVLTESAPVLIAREFPSGGRVLLVGSGNWMRTSVADAATNAGGDRVSLVHPGNHELMLAGTAWLSGLDDRIARGALSQEVARLRSIDAGAREFWGWVLLGVLPAGSLAAGFGMWLWRRH